MLPLTYHMRSLHVRQIRTLATLACVSLVTAVFCYLLCFAQGLRRVFERSGDPRNMIVLADGATAESNSAVTHDAFRELISVPHLAIDASGRPALSPEVVVQTEIARRGDMSGARAGVPVRGVRLDVALRIHSDVELVSGRWFHEGRDELVVGIKAAERFHGTDIGETVECGRRAFTIVGVFRAAGGTREGELWGHLSNVASAYRRVRYSSATIQLESADDAVVGAAKERIAAVGGELRAVSEPDYYAGQARGAAEIERMALALAFVMGIGVVFAAVNAMHASVAGRSREFAMLRAIGFSPGGVLAGILFESLVISLLGGALGCVMCAIAIAAGGQTRDFGTMTTFSSVAFGVRMTSGAVIYSMGVSGLIGVLGGLWPGCLAVRGSVIKALRAI